jgi:uncharacterized protein
MAMADRDRDEQGRALNARPRDGLGRPLARDAEGVDQVAEGLVLDPETALTTAQQLLDDGRPFHAHEVLEAVWKSAPPAEAQLWRALAQLAVGITHLRRGNDKGATALLARSRSGLIEFTQPGPHRIDVTGLTAWIDAVTSAGLPRTEPLAPIRLTVASSDG